MPIRSGPKPASPASRPGNATSEFVSRWVPVSLPIPGTRLATELENLDELMIKTNEHPTNFAANTCAVCGKSTAEEWFGWILSPRGRAFFCTPECCLRFLDEPVVPETIRNWMWQR